MSVQRILALSVVLMVATSNSLPAASFLALGDFAGGSGSPISTGDPGFESGASGVSPNGSIVVGKSLGTNHPNGSGSSYAGAFKWTSGSGMVNLPGDSTSSYYSVASGVSNNDIAIGFGDTSEFGYLDHMLRWTAPSGSSPAERMTLLGPTTRQFGYSYSGSHPIDASGTFSVGYIAEIPYSNSYEAMVWNANGTPLKLGWLGPGPISPPPQPNPSTNGYKDYSYAHAISSNGKYIVGSSNSGFRDDPSQTDGIDDSMDPKFTPLQAVMWTDASATWTTAPIPVGLGQVKVGPTNTGTNSVAVDVTNDGLRFVGSGCTTNDCFDDKVDRNGLLQAGETSVGFVDTWTGTTVAFLGTVGNTDLVSLGTLPTSGPNAVAASGATAISGNGTTVVGWSTTTAPIQENDTDTNNLTHDKPISITGNEAFIWDPVLTGGVMVKLQDFLIGQGLGTQLAGWTLKEASDISDDGTVIVGTGINPSGNYEAFRAVIDLAPQENGDFNDDGVVNAADYVVWRKFIGTAPEYEIWKNNFGKTFPGSGGGSFEGTGGSVPEPASVILVVVGIGMCALNTGRGHRRRRD